MSFYYDLEEQCVHAVSALVLVIVPKVQWYRFAVRRTVMTNKTKRSADTNDRKTKL